MLCAAGYNIRWLLRAIIRLGLKGPLLRLLALLGALAEVMTQPALTGYPVASRFRSAMR